MILFALSVGALFAAAPPDLPLNLQDGAVAVSADEQAYVHNAIHDLQHEVSRLAKPGLAVYHEVDQALASGSSVILVVGRKLAEQLAVSETLPFSELSKDGFILRSFPLSGKPGKHLLVAAGADSHGTNYAVLELVRRLSLSVSARLQELNIKENPRYELRGVYAHPAWVYNHPFALRSWTLEDWKRYVDILAYLRFNLFQFWPLAEILPSPLSVEDESYLFQFNEVIRYALVERGFREVWPGICANNIAYSSLGRSMRDREFFQAQHLLDPGDSFQMAELRRSRANFYRTVPNGTGYWIIDSDPGSWQGSPATEFVDILAMNRQFIDAYTTGHGETKLIYWMLWGWGAGTRDQNRDRIVDQMAKRIHLPWLITPYDRHTLDQVAKKSLLDRTVYFPYGVVEAEPFTPITYTKLEHGRTTFQYLSQYQGIRGVMCNSQSPLLQLPNLIFFSQLSWNPSVAERSDPEALADIAALLYPEQAGPVANAWLSLTQDDAETSIRWATELQRLADTKTEARGAIGKFLFPRSEWFLPYLIRLLKAHTYSLRSRESLDEGTEGSLGYLISYLTEALEIQRLHGFTIPPAAGGAMWLPDRPWVVSGPDYERVRDGWIPFAKTRPQAAIQIKEEIRQTLRQQRYQQPVLERMLTFVLPL